MEKSALVIALGIIIGSILSGARVYWHHKRWERISLAGRVLYGVLCVVICLIVWGISAVYQDWYYEEAPAPYASLEAAAADGCVVIESMGSFLDGEEHWEAFLRYAQKGLAAVVSIAVSDGKTVGAVDQLYFDGAFFHYTDNPPYIHQKGETERYPYLLFLVEEPDGEEGKLYSRLESWVLTDKADLTLDEIPQILYEEDSGYRARRLTMNYEWIPEDKLFGP